MPVATISVLKSAPLKFLKAFPIKIQYNSKDSKLIEQYYYGQKAGVLYFNNGFPNVDDPGSAEVTKAHGLVAKKGGPHFYELSGEADVMLTTQLSGCCVVLDDSGATPKIAHVQPDSGSDGVTLQQSLSGSGYKLYGKADYHDNYAYVLGVKTDGWRFYTQKRLNDERKISIAKEIFV